MSKICILTDLHISDKDDFPLQINTRTNFINVLNDAKLRNPGLFILAGDLCHKYGDIDIYNWIKGEMDLCGTPYKVIAGNHDDSVLMSEVFGAPLEKMTNERYYKLNWNGINMLFLDSSKAYLQQSQWQWLEEEISTSTNKDIFLIMHHPPVKSHSLQLEPQYEFEQMSDFLALCTKYGDKKFHVFCGHYHLERTVIIQNIMIYITPSTFVQVDPEAAEFLPLHPYVGYRELFFDNQGAIITDCRYI